MRKNYVSPDALAGIKLAFPNAEYDAETERPAVFIGADELIALLTFLRDDSNLQLTRAENVTAVDWKDRFEMVYPRSPALVDGEGGTGSRCSRHSVGDGGVPGRGIRGARGL